MYIACILPLTCLLPIYNISLMSHSPHSLPTMILRHLPYAMTFILCTFAGMLCIDILLHCVAFFIFIWEEEEEEKRRRKEWEWMVGHFAFCVPCHSGGKACLPWRGRSKLRVRLARQQALPQPLTLPMTFSYAAALLALPFKRMRHACGMHTHMPSPPPIVCMCL